MNRIRAAVTALLLAAIFAVPFAGQAQEKGRKLTIMVYLCGSNLESSYGSATSDLHEMLQARYDPKQVTLLVMAGGTSAWTAGYDVQETRILEIDNGKTRTVWNGGLLNMGSEEALGYLLRFGQEKYPAEGYALILWDHGGGPLEGVCWDELFSMDSLSLNELTRALDSANLARKLRWIGFDACLMGSAEVAAALAPYAEYMIASQETEPASGWNYAFLNGTEADESGADTGRRIVDAYFTGETDSAVSRTMACIDLDKIDAVRTAMDDFFEPLSREVNAGSFSRLSGLRFSVAAFGKAGGDDVGSGYDLVDLRDLIKQYSRDDSGDTLLGAIGDAVVYSRSDHEGSSGLSVYHPYDNKQKYMDRWRGDYEALAFCSGYEAYIGRFGAILTGQTLADWIGLTTETVPAGDGGGNLFTLQLTPEQQETFAGAQLIVLAALDMDNGIYGTQITSMEGTGKGDTVYAPVYLTEAGMDENGRLTAAYAGRAIYAVDEAGNPVLGPLTYRLSEDGSAYSIHGLYQDRSGREDFAGDLDVLFELKPGEGDELILSGVLGYDSATQTYTSRIPVEEKLYTDLQFYPDTRKMPEDPEQLPGFERWKQKSRLNVNCPSIRLPSVWGFRFFPDQMSASQLYAAFQVTDTQRSVHMSRPAAVDNPNLENIAVTPEMIETDNCRIRIHLLRNDSPMQPGIDLIAEVTNPGTETELMILDPILLNGSRDAAPGKLSAISFTDLAPGETRVGILHIDRTALTGIESVHSLTAGLKIRPENQKKTETDLAFAVAPLETGAVSGEGIWPLARTEENGVVWELRGLEQNRYGDMTGLMRIENTRDEPLEGFGTLAVNGLLIHGSSSQRIRVAPHAEGYLPFTMNNSAVLKYPLSLNGRSHRFWLATRDTIPLYGIREIREIQIMMASGYRVEHCPVLTLSSPWPLSSSEEAEAAAGIPLMTGEVEAFMERVLRAENGIGIRAVFENHRDQPVSVGIGHCSLNGTATGDSGHSLLIPAGGRTVYTFALKRDGAAEENITEAGMSFQINREYGTPDAVIHLNPEEGTGYLDPSEIRIDAVDFRQPRVTVLNPEQRVEDACDLTLSGTILSGSQEVFDADWYDFDQKHLRLMLELENTTDRPQFYVSSELVVNGTTVTDRHFIPGSADPGEIISDSCSIDLSALEGITEIREISFDLSWYPTDKSGSRQTVSLCFRFGDGGLRLPIR